MRSLLPLLLLAPADPAPGDPPADERIRVAVHAGRATLHGAGTQRSLRRAHGEVPASAEGRLVVAVASEVSLRWSGGMSLRVEGPAELSWGGDEASGTCRVASARRLEWEARDEGRGLALGGDWNLSLSAGAARLESVGRGSWLAYVHAGGPLRVGTAVRRRSGTWPAVVHPGRTARLDPPAERGGQGALSSPGPPPVRGCTR